MANKIKDERIIFPSDPEGRPREKKYIEERTGDYTGFSSILRPEVGYTLNGTKELRNLLGGNYFPFPKPSSLIKELIEQSTGKDNDLVLDFFAGSGTTAHAVMKLNVEDGGTRKFILTQLPERIERDNDAKKAGFETISQITIKRVENAGSSLKKEGNDKDFGFKVFELTHSIFPENTFTPDSEKSEKENLEALKIHIANANSKLLKDFEPEDLLCEILLKDGFELNYKTERIKDFKKNEVLKVTDGHKEALICLDASLKEETIKQLEGFKDNRFICLHRAVDTTKKWSLSKVFGDLLTLV